MNVLVNFSGTRLYNNVQQQKIVKIKVSIQHLVVNAMMKSIYNHLESVISVLNVNMNLMYNFNFYGLNVFSFVQAFKEYYIYLIKHIAVKAVKYQTNIVNPAIFKIHLILIRIHVMHVNRVNYQKQDKIGYLVLLNLHISAKLVIVTQV